MRLLSVEKLNVFYGAIHALKDVSLSVGEGEIVSVIGANGAGKSTLMYTLAGVLKPRSGKILYEGIPLPLAPHEVVAVGISLVPERRRVLANLTVKENLILGAFSRSDREGISESLDYVFALFPVLKQRLQQYAGTLSGGEQQMLVLGRGLMSDPKLLLLDEPSLGLAPILVHQLFDTIREIAQKGTTIFLAEQNALKALEVAERAYVLETGHIVLSGTGSELLHNPAVQEAYLGVRHRRERMLSP